MERETLYVEEKGMGGQKRGGGQVDEGGGGGDGDVMVRMYGTANMVRLAVVDRERSPLGYSVGNID